MMYHFTSSHHLPVILNSGYLKLCDSNVDIIQPDRSVVWLTDLPEVEPNSHGLGAQKTAVRITVDVPGIQWLKWAPTAYMDPNWRHHVIEGGGGEEAAEHWFIHPAPIKASRWTEIRASGYVLNDWHLIAGGA